MLLKIEQAGRRVVGKGQVLFPNVSNLQEV